MVVFRGPNSVSKTANQSGSFQPRDDHEPNTYAFQANQSAEFRSHDTDRRYVQIGFIEMELLEKGNETRLKAKGKDSPLKVDGQRWQFPASFLLTPESIEAFLK